MDRPPHTGVAGWLLLRRGKQPYWAHAVEAKTQEGSRLFSLLFARAVGLCQGLWAQVLIQKTSGFIAAGLVWQVLSIPS